MPGPLKNFIGLEGFIWWIGVVEDRQDPEQLGRVRVRCFGWHTEDKNKIPTEALPWAHPVIPINHPAVYTPKEGDMVFGFFVDGTNAQNPAIMGVLPGKPEAKPKYENGFADPRKNFANAPKKENDPGEAYPKSKYLKEQTTNRLARGKAESTVIETRKKNLKKNVKSAGGITWSEPSPTFKPIYPYNYALESESGHAFELDDTPKNERVQIAHRKGAYIEFDKDGSRIDRVQKDNYCVIMGDDFIYIKGKAAITVDGNFNLRTGIINLEAAAINMAATGDIKIKGKAVKIESTGGMDLKAGSAGKFTAGGRLDLKGATAGLGGAIVDIPAGKVNLQGGSVSSASGAGITGGGSQATEEERSAAAADDAAAAKSKSDFGDLEEVQVTGRRTNIGSGEELGEITVTGKRVGGESSSVSKTFGKVIGAATSLLKQYASAAPRGLLEAGTENFQNLVDENVGNILGFPIDQKDETISLINDVSIESENNSLPFNLDPKIQSEILNSYGFEEAQSTNMIAKRTYPKTETVTVSNQKTLSLGEYKRLLVTGKIKKGTTFEAARRLYAQNSNNALAPQLQTFNPNASENTLTQNEEK